MITMTETQRRRRGHAFLPPKAVLAKIPELYATEGTPAEDKIVWAHYFSAGSDHWITEMTQDGDDVIVFGYAKLAAWPDGAEWGYISLSELETVNVHHGMVIVERDCHWTPKPFSEVRA